jgi:threonine/homoserine/homoserine lactone efflux protein
MIEQSFDLVSLVTICVLGAMSPGPSLFVILNIAVQSSVSNAICAAWAHALGIGLWATLSLSAWHFALNYSASISEGLSLLASLYLLYMAYTLILSLREPSTLNIDEGRQKNTVKVQIHSKRSAFKAGLSIALANPKILLFFSVIYPQILPQDLLLVDGLTAISVPLIIDGTWYHMITRFSAKLGLLKLIDRYKRVTTLVMTILFLFIALRTLATIL